MRSLTRVTNIEQLKELFNSSALIVPIKASDDEAANLRLIDIFGAPGADGYLITGELLNETCKVNRYPDERILCVIPPKDVSLGGEYFYDFICRITEGLDRNPLDEPVSTENLAE